MAEWKYKTKTEAGIRAALLELLATKSLADITVSELTRKAHVSRSTFYQHYGNAVDVYDDVVEEFAHGLSPVMGQVACTGDAHYRGEPFCARLRKGGPFATAVGDDRFLSSFLETAGNLEKHDLYDLLTKAGYSSNQARSLCAFQLAGCFTAVKTCCDEGERWEDVKQLIDRFILGGIAACLAQAQADKSR